MGSKPVHSDAAIRLKTELAPRMSRADLAERLGVTQQAVSAWICGTRRPNTETMAKIESLLGIPMSAWIPVPKRRERKAA